MDKYLIPPFPEDYATYSEQEKIEKTEWFYEKKHEVYSIVESFEEECSKRMDVILKKRLI